MKRLLLFAVIFLVLAVVPFRAAISPDSTSDSLPQTVQTGSWNHTIAAGCQNPVLLVDAGSKDTTIRNVTSASYDGVALTIIGAHTQQNRGDVEQWGLINPTHDGAAHLISVTWSAAPAQGWEAKGISLCGADQTAPFEANNGASGTIGVPTVSVMTITDNDWLDDVLYANPATTESVNCSQTNDFGQQVDTQGWTITSSHRGPVTPPGSFSMCYNTAPSNAWAMRVVAVKPAGAAPAGVNKRIKIENLDPISYSIDPTAISNFPGCDVTDTACTLEIKVCDDQVPPNCLHIPADGAAHLMQAFFIAHQTIPSVQMITSAVAAKASSVVVTVAQ